LATAQQQVIMSAVDDRNVLTQGGMDYKPEEYCPKASERIFEGEMIKLAISSRGVKTQVSTAQLGCRCVSNIMQWLRAQTFPICPDHSVVLDRQKTTQWRKPLLLKQRDRWHQRAF
jgi:hypothetical protein